VEELVEKLDSDGFERMELDLEPEWKEFFMDGFG